MGKKYSNSLFIFRRDFRLQDNIGLIEALENSEEVLPIFIFDPRQVNKANEYRGEKLVQFMTHSLAELSEDVRRRDGIFRFFEGQPEKVLDQILQTKSFNAVYLNKDYTPFSRARDESLEKVCKKHTIDFHAFDDALLTKPGSVSKDDGSPYTVYTFFAKKARNQEIAEPKVNSYKNFDRRAIPLDNEIDIQNRIKDKAEGLYLRGGRKEAVEILKQLERYEEYEMMRNIPSLRGTTGLSAHHKFGTISIRETYHSVRAMLGKEHGLISELYWRDFFYHIAWHFPRVFDGAFHDKFSALDWRNDLEEFRCWCEGKTGFPLVDAGMRELVQTGFMHNRVRMVVASFLVKDLQIDWRWGEKFFAQHLLDYDPAVNNGNWQWAASTGCDAQPYFRIFNPWTQQKKFDPDAEYILKWVPELKELSPKQIHSLETNAEIAPKDYPKPIVSHAEARLITKQMYDVN